MVAQSPNTQPLTALGALPRLQRDERLAHFHRTDQGLLCTLVQLCEKTTGVVSTPLRELALKCSQKHPRSIRRHLKNLDRLGIISYMPGRGKGNLGEIALLFESWGLQKGTNLSPFTHHSSRARNSTSRARHSTTTNGVHSTHEVQYIQPSFSSTLNALDETKEIHHPPSPFEITAINGVRKFHSTFGNDAILSSPSLFFREVSKMKEIMRQYSLETRREAWGIIVEQYQNRQKKPYTVGLFRFFCENLKGVIFLRKRTRKLQEWHRKQAAKKAERLRSMSQLTTSKENPTIIPEMVPNESYEPPPKHPFDPDLPPPGVETGLWKNWIGCVGKLRGKMFPLSFETWIQSLTPMRKNGDILEVVAPTEFYRSWIEQHYRKDIEAAVGNTIILGVHTQGKTK